MMTPAPTTRCLLLACGNPLRGDDGLGPWLAEWAEKRFRAEPGVRVVAAQQWTPEMAEDVARAGAVLFLDLSATTAPGVVELLPVAPAAELQDVATHHLHAAELLALGRDLYASLPGQALLLTVGAGSTELGEAFSAAVQAALPEACYQIEKVVLRFLG